jgi:hypothetical protein
LPEKPTKNRMEPAEYREFLRQVELQSIVLDTCSVKTNRGNIGSNMKLDIQHKVGYALKEETLSVISSSYDFSATKSSKKDFALKVMCVYRVELTSGKPITDDFMEIFAKINVQTNTWPYFREFMQSMLQRIGYPPLTLPFLKP